MFEILLVGGTSTDPAGAEPSVPVITHGSEPSAAGDAAASGPAGPNGRSPTVSKRN